MLTTNVLAKKAEVPVYTVRHYTRIGMLNPTQNETNGYKIYKQSDEILLKFIRNAKELGFKLKEISQILGEADKGNGKCTGELVGNGRRYAEWSFDLSFNRIYCRLEFSLLDLTVTHRLYYKNETHKNL